MKLISGKLTDFSLAFGCIMRKKLTTYGLFLIGILLFLLDGVTPLEIGDSIAFGLLVLMTVTSGVLVIGYYLQKLDFKRTFKFSLILGGIACIVQGLINWGGDWKTQTVIYQYNHLPNRTIEFQMQDIGALGYNRRTVDRLKLLPFISWIEEIDLKK